MKGRLKEPASTASTWKTEEAKRFGRLFPTSKLAPIYQRYLGEEVHLLKLSERTIDRYISEEIIHVIRCGPRRILIPDGELRKLLTPRHGRDDARLHSSTSGDK